ncbi:hypothetical protein CkaCkLH20_05497 [Colletotrichum karsti]|uniref:Uncharacterized protein n=1 Tax=Colletotrichum karsti TaxID=1095194 RepID=A0A9P6LLI5_9PEZI|nr:uncharacterized protein CkaCkLH20_05497 [Colletotrichum karsti]KAF9877231.1 hypothetical protein CkaCkLH20_05497 [Colletotrichum karsti]
MESQQPPAGTAAAAASPSHRKGHKPSSSLGSLYEVLADLDENQLQYLIQEMNHTGHQNVPVSKAVTAFETKNPTDSLTTLRSSMLPPAPGQSAPDVFAPGLQRQLSKSQQGKLRLQTAFQRTPSLRQRQRQDSPSTHQPLHSSPLKDLEPQPVNSQPTQPVEHHPVQHPAQQSRPEKEIDKRASDFSLFDFGFAGNESREPATQPEKEEQQAQLQPEHKTNVDTQPPVGSSFNFGFSGSKVEPRERSEERRPGEPEAPRGRKEITVETSNLPAPTGRSRTKSVAYKRIPRPDFNLPSGITVTDLLELLELEYQSANPQQPSRTPSFSSSPSSTHLSPASLPLPRANAARRANIQTPSWPASRPLRRHSSRLDMMLDAERNVSGAEEIGLGMLEPRPLRSSSVGTRSASLGNSAASTPIMSMDSFCFDGPVRADTTPPVMEGIFDVLENQ